MALLPARRAIVAALVLLVCGTAAGTAVAHDGPPHWWHGHKGRDGGHGRPTTTTTTRTDGDDGEDDTPTTSTTTAAQPSTTTTTTTTTATTTDASSAPTPDTTAAAAPAPELNRTVALAATSGTVLVRAPGADAAQPLTTVTALPTGTRVDTRHGEVVLTSAVDTRGTTQTGRFSGGVFEVRQAAHGYTQLVLVGGHWAACKAKAKPAARAAYVGARAIAARKKKPIRRLWGSDDHGRFQTRGSGSVATVRGTRWLTEDSCEGTRTTVTKGAVDVRSKRTGKTVRVTAGHSVLVKR